MRRLESLVVIATLAAVPLAAAVSVAEPASAITVSNHSSLTICHVYIGAAESDELDRDRLAEGERIAPGAARPFEVPGGMFEVIARDCDDATVADALRTEPGAEVVVGSSTTVALQVVNDSGRDICQIVDEWLDGARDVFPHWQDPSNPDYVERMPMQPGEAYWVFLPAGPRHLAARTCDGDEVAQAEEVEVPRASAWRLRPPGEMPPTAEPSAFCAQRTGIPRLVGLERLYFERIEGPVARHSSVSGSLAETTLRILLPERLAEDDRHWQSYSPENTDRVLSVTDFRLPLVEGSREILLREVADESNRITDQWWVLYEDGCRAGGWYFTPAPSRTEGKLLTALRIAGVNRSSPGQVTFQVRGRMERPGGAWWDRTAELVFSATGRALEFAAVASSSSTYSDYERDGQEPRTLSVRTERLVAWKGRLVREVRSYDEPAALVDGPGRASKPKARVERRPAETPSFIERGGR